MSEVTITPLQQFPDERGSNKLIMQSGDPGFGDIQQVYVSTVYPGTVKGWHRHKQKTLNYTCVAGIIRLVITPDLDKIPIRRVRPSDLVFQEIVMGETNYCRVSIPPGTWNAFMGLGYKEAIVVNCATLPYSEADIERLPWNYFAYDWTFKHG